MFNELIKLAGAHRERFVMLQALSIKSDAQP